MAQHFLLSAAARSLSRAKVMRMSDRGAENVLLRVRWPQTDGKPVCPRCGCLNCYDCRRSDTQPRWRCKACRADFSVTSDTLFAWHKLPLKSYLMAIAMFCNEVKGKGMLAFCRDLDVQYKTAFVLAHKLREAMASATKALRIGGEGRTAETDGAYFGGHVRPENLAAERIDRRLAENQSDKRQVVVAMRERGGRTLTQVFASEADAAAVVRLPIAKGTTVHADESPAWNTPHAALDMQRVNHQDGYSVDGALYQWRGVLFLPSAARRTRAPSPYLRTLSPPLRPGGSLARRSAPGQQRRAGPRHRRATEHAKEGGDAV